MGKTITLKLRERSDSIRLPVQVITGWMELDEDEAKDAMFEFFRPFEKSEARIHDKVFLETTMNWSPVRMTERGPVSTGLPLKEQMRWIRIADRLDEIEDDEEGDLKLYSKDIKLIVERWRDPEFKMESIHQRPWIAAFLMEFQQQTGEWIDEELEKEFDEEEEFEDENASDPELEHQKVHVSEDGANS